MPQSDFQLENIDYPSFRQELNNALKSVAGSNSGATAPTVNFPYQFWADTASNKLKIRKGDSSVWIILGDLDSAYFGLTPDQINALSKDANLSDVASKDSARSNLGLSTAFFNEIINGDFRINQRGASSYPFTNNIYSLDRWKLLTDAGGGTVASGTISQQTFAVGQTGVPGEPQNFIRLSNSNQGSNLGTGSYAILSQAIEDARKFAGRQVTITFYAQSTITGKTLGLELLQNFGTGGSTAVTCGSQSFALSAAWQKFTATINVPSLSGKTLGSNHSLNLNFWLQAGSNFSSRAGSTFNWQGQGDINIANVQIQSGSVSTPFESRPLGLELSLCQRYYEEINFFADGYGTANQAFNFPIYYKENKRVVPTFQHSATTATNISLNTYFPNLSTMACNCSTPATGAYSLVALVKLSAEF